MRIPLSLVALLAVVSSSFAALPESVKGRTIRDVNVISGTVLRRSISPKFYDTLLISPIEGWVVVRGTLSGNRVYGERIVRSDAGSEFNKIALQAMRDIRIAGDYKLDTQIKTSSVLLHLLVYKIADGTMVLYFPTLEGAGQDQDHYWGSAKLAVLKNDGSWTEIYGPRKLQGKGFAVRRAGLRSNAEIAMKLEQIGGPTAKDQGR